ncbi:MAG: class I SAM-dependent methyltransferase [Gammaproteobacteria bacterium]
MLLCIMSSIRLREPKEVAILKTLDVQDTMQKLIDLTERDLIPDALIRRGIRKLLRERLIEIEDGDCEAMARREREFAQHMREAAVALVPEVANEQHYEVPTEFFLTVLGKRLKYSSCYWDNATTLEQAEDRSLTLSCEHARIEDGQRILELGCGWGSLSLWLAAHYPNATITAVSNSAVQRAHIEAQAAERGHTNLTVITADMNDFTTDKKFDRVMSIEMFEHMRNWPELYKRIYGWLDQDGLFFKHVFCHRQVPYPFEDRGPSDWMTRYFFGGGMMPSDALPYQFPEHLQVLDQWRWSGTHYSKTLEAWLERMDASGAAGKALIADTYGAEQQVRWWVRWRLFFLACSELFNYDNGQKWWVSHYLLQRRGQ